MGPATPAYRFGARARSAAIAVASLAEAPEALVPGLVAAVVAGRRDRERLLDALLARPVSATCARGAAAAMGPPQGYHLRERARVAAWLATAGAPSEDWIEGLRDFPLPEESRRAGGTAADPTERFASARLAMATSPGDATRARELRDAATAARFAPTLGTLFATGWLDALVLEEGTAEAFRSLPWAEHGLVKLAFARRVTGARAALRARGGASAELAAVVALACGRPAEARDELAAFLPDAAHAYLLACAGTDGKDRARALPYAAQRDRLQVLLDLSVPSPTARPAQVLDRVGAVGLPDPRDPLFDALALALARTVEAARPTPADRARLEGMLACVPSWRRRLPASDRVWLATVEALSRPTDPAATAAALQDLLLVVGSAAWFVAVADRLRADPIRAWLTDEWGAATAFGGLVHALTVQATAHLDASALAPADRDALRGADVPAALAAARNLLHREGVRPTGVRQ